MAAPKLNGSLDLVEKFSSILSELGGQPIIAQSIEEGIDALLGILRSKAVKNAVVANLPARLQELIGKSRSKDTVRYSFLNSSLKNETLRLIESADAGLTWADFGIASRGALVEVAHDDVEKLASSLPPVHVAFLSASNLVSDLADAFVKIEEIVRSSHAGKTQVISIISGPSKTSDIEMRMLYGVHGPNSLYVIIILGGTE